MSTRTSYFYETCYILKPGTSETDAGTIHTKVDNVITKFNGELKQRDDWGVRELAYQIDKQTNGRFCVINYTGSAGVVEEIERHFKILEDVIRFLTVQLPADYSYENVKKQIAQTEEDVKKNRELRKKGQGLGH